MSLTRVTSKLLRMSGRDQHRHDDDDGRGRCFFSSRPGDLLELAGDLDDRREHLLVPVGDDRGRAAATTAQCALTSRSLGLAK